MNRLRTTAAVALSLSLGMVSVLNADVRTEQKTKFQLGGVLGRMVNMFSRSAREGVTSTVALKNNRKATLNDTTGQIIDLNEEKIYDLDIKGKKYKVTTFAELRKQMEDARKQAEADAKKQQQQQPSQSTQKPADTDKKQTEYEIDFDIKNTNDKKTINGFDTHHAIVTVTVREKGKTLEQSGGLVMTTDLWLAPEIAAMKELRDFDLRYAQKMFGPMVSGATPRDMATALAMYPQMKPALDKMAAEGGKIQGTPIQTVMTMDAVASAEQAAENSKKESKDESPSATVGGLLGGLARRGSRNSSESNASNNPNRATFMTTTTELLKVSTDVSADAVAVPANFKLDK